MATDDRNLPLLVSWGELLWDLFPEGACLGGAPSNVAVHLAQLRCRSALVTSLGNDALGDSARLELGARGLDLRGIQIHASLPTGRVGIEVLNGEAQYTLHDGAWREIAYDTQARTLAQSAKAIVFGTLSQESPQGLASWRAAMTAAAADTIKVFDPNLRGERIDPELVRETLQAANVAKVNDNELAMIEKAYQKSDGLRWLLEDMQLDRVAHTHGSKGATLYTRRESVTHPGYPATPGGDNVGAGDGFTAVLALAAVRRTPLAQTLDAANRLGSYIASHRGATPILPTWLRKEVDALLGPSA